VKKTAISVLITFSNAPSGNDAVGTSRDRCTRQTDRLDKVVVF